MKEEVTAHVFAIWRPVPTHKPACWMRASRTAAMTAARQSAMESQVGRAGVRDAAAMREEITAHVFATWRPVPTHKPACWMRASRTATITARSDSGLYLGLWYTGELPRLA